MQRCLKIGLGVRENYAFLYQGIRNFLFQGDIAWECFIVGTVPQFVHKLYEYVVSFYTFQIFMAVTK
jgi:hypothetical protein